MKSTWSAIVMLGALSATAAFAHEEPPDAGLVLDAGEEVEEAKAPLQTTVKSTRLGRSASEIVIGEGVLRAAPRTGAVDLLRLVPGLVASQHSGEGKAHQLFLRGFDAVHGQDVELNVAGLPVNEVSHLHALGYADINWLIPDAVREVRVTEGSYRAWQGDFAVAGTIRYDLGLEEQGINLSASAGSFGRKRLFAGLRPFAAKETFVAGEWVQGDGFGPQRAFSRGSVLGQAVIPFEHLTLRTVVGAATSTFDSPGVVREDAFRSGAAGFFDAFGKGQGGRSERHQLLVGVDLPWERAKTTLEFFTVWSEVSLRNDFTGFTRGPEGDGLFQHNRDLFGGLRLEHHQHLSLFGRSFSLDAGLSGRRDGIRQVQRRYVASTGYLDDATIDADITQNAGTGWAELSTTVSRFRFMVGGRADASGFEVRDRVGQGGQRSSFGVHPGLKAAAEVRLGDALRLHANYGDGFRSPQARSLADGEVAPFVNVRGAELGASLEFSRFVAKLAAFGSSVSDDAFFDHTVSSTTYLGPSLRGGVSVVATAQPIAGLLLSGSFTAATARLVKTGAQLPYIAPLVSRFDGSYTRDVRIGEERFTLRGGLGLTFIGSRPLPFGDVSRPVFLADARASVRWQALEVVLDAQNLLGSQWRDGEFTYASTWDPSVTASRLPSRHFTAGAPRSLFVTLELHLPVGKGGSR